MGGSIDRIGCFPQKINGARSIISARKQRIALGDAFPDGGGIRQHLTAGHQRLLFACNQAGILDLLYLITQQVNLSLFFTLIGDDGIQLLFDLDKLPVNSIILLIHHPVLGVGIQNTLMAGRVQQAYGIVLAVDVDEPTAQFPQNGCCGRHSVDAAGALALGSDLTAQGQRFGALIPRLFQAVQHCRRNIIKCRPDDCFCSPRAHQILGGAVAQNGIDGVDQDRFARTGLAGKDIQALLKMHVGLLDDCNIFNLQTAQHVRSLLPLFLPDVMPKLGANGLCVPL